MKKRGLATAKDCQRMGLIPLESLDLSKVNNFSDLTTALRKVSFGGRKLGEAEEVLYRMVTDPDSFVVGTFSGAMTAAKMGLLICDMIEQKMIQAVVSTGALVTHGLIEAVGLTHFKCSPEKANDQEFFDLGLNRIYDTLEMEQNLDDLENILKLVFKGFNPAKEISSFELCQKVGKYLAENTKGRGILKSAFLHKVPVYIPAFPDSEFGLDFALFNRVQKRKRRKKIIHDPFLDLEHFTKLILKQKKLGIFTIGGGVPRNWAQQVGPYTDLINKRTKDKVKGVQYHYGVRICPEPAEWGGLSGATYEEGISWGKFVPPAKGGMQAEVLCDATIAWPIILKAVLERLQK
jgi:deoxyhypusine synthase